MFLLPGLGRILGRNGYREFSAESPNMIWNFCKRKVVRWDRVPFELPITLCNVTVVLVSKKWKPKSFFFSPIFLRCIV